MKTTRRPKPKRRRFTSLFPGFCDRSASTSTVGVDAIRQAALQLRDVSDLTDFSGRLRHSILESPASTDQTDNNRIAAFALALEGLRRTIGVKLYDVQLLAAHHLASGKIVEMQTGEGKTFAAFPAAVLHGLSGRGVHIATPNAYLAERDYGNLRDAFKVVGVTIGLISDDQNPDQKRNAYSCDVTYGTGHEFGFDYLRDQLTLRNRSEAKLGQRTLQRFEPAPACAPNRMEPDTPVQRPLAFAIIDEADHVLIDDATSPLVLAVGSDQESPDKLAVLAARAIGQKLDETHYESVGCKSIRLTQAGRLAIHDESAKIPTETLIRPWASYIETALSAAHEYVRDEDYVRHEDTIRIVDSSTGRIFADRTWQSGIHQAIEAKERLPISSENEVLAQITRQRFYRLYRQIGGMTGTTTGCRRELQKVYGLATQVIPTRLPPKRLTPPTKFFETEAAKRSAITAEVIKVRSAGRPVLIGTRTIEESRAYADDLRSAGVDHQVLNGCQDADEATLIAGAGISGQVTIATNLAGRGTDIRLDAASRAAGGLHVIATQSHESPRVDRQLIGRSARGGDPGSAQVYTSLEDHLIATHGQWLQKSRAIRADSNGRIHTDLTRQIRRLQSTASRSAYAIRRAQLNANPVS